MGTPVTTTAAAGAVGATATTHKRPHRHTCPLEGPWSTDGEWAGAQGRGQGQGQGQGQGHLPPRPRSLPLTDRAQGGQPLSPTKRAKKQDQGQEEGGTNDETGRQLASRYSATNCLLVSVLILY